MIRDAKAVEVEGLGETVYYVWVMVVIEFGLACGSRSDRLHLRVAGVFEAGEVWG